jgi:hypothetical protein
MRRRDFINLVGSTVVAWPVAARAQQSARLPQVAILRGEVAGDPEGLRNTAALLQGLQALGWTQGQNLRIEQRWAGGSVDAMNALARELVSLEPSAIVVVSTPATVAVMRTASGSKQKDSAAIRDLQPVDAAEQRRLAGARWSENTDRLAFRYQKIDVLKRPMVLEGFA